jgi:predicted nucleotidyltransferase
VYKITMTAVAQKYAETVRRLASGRGVARLSFFGSVARGEDRPDSDVDMLVEFQSATAYSLLDLCEMESLFQAALHRPVHLVTMAEIHPRYRQNVNTDKIVIYDQAV